MSEEQELQDRALLPLDAPRAVSIKSKDHTYTYRVRRIAQADWLKFFQGIVHQTLEHGGERERVFESESALLELVDSVTTSVDGYGDLNATKNWKRCLPLRHLIAVGIALRNVGVSAQADDAPALCDLVEVRLDATWSAGADGKMLLYSGLVHRFRQPSLAQLKKFNFESARVKVSGTPENGVTVYPARQAIAMKIYDELIESVDGYTVGGQPLASIDAIKAEMDGAHKATAALALFQPDEEVAIQ